MAPLDVQTVLAPIDGSDESLEAAEYAAAIAERYDARVHALYVLGESVVRAMTTGDVGADAVAEETRAFVGDVRALAVEHDVPFGTSTAYGFSTIRKSVHPGSVILDCADQLAADFIVIPRVFSEEGAPDVLEKAAEYVLLYASQPVLSV